MSRLGKVAVAVAMAFSVGAAWAETPAKFVDYIESDGGGGQYVTLGDYRPKGDSILVATFSTANRKVSHAVFCSRGVTTTTNSITLFYSTSNGLRFDYGITGTTGSKYVTVGENVKCTVGINNAAFYLNGTKNANLSRTKADFTAGGPLMLFAAYTTTEDGEVNLSTLATYAKMKLYRFQAYDRTAGGAIVPKVNLWPCVDANGVAGLYDSLSGTIYRSEGGKAFTASETETEGPNATVDKLVSTCGGTDWFNGANWSLGVPPTATQDVVIDGLTASASGSVAVKSLTVRGAKGVLNLGSSTARPNITATIAEDLFVTNGATVNVYAGRLPDYVAKFEEGKAAFHAALYTNANVVTVGGDLTVGASSFLKPNNDPLTGTPVFFRVGGDFNLKAGGTVSADDGGWDWVDKAGMDVPTGAGSGTHRGASNVNDTPCFCLATGTPKANVYTTGGSYGGLGYNGIAVYGLEKAPYLPGSPGGCWGNTAEGRGGGSICIFTIGAARLDGTLTAQAGATGYARGSGGSIWIVADSITPGATLAVNAKGCSSSSNSYAPGGGGRVAFEAGVTDEILEAFLAGGTPEGLTYDQLAIEGLNIAGGKKPSKAGQDGSVGTAVNIFDPMRTTTLTIVGLPQNAISEGVAYGDQQISFGSVSQSVVDYGYDVGDAANVRYSCVGYVVSNATAEVASGPGQSVSFTAVKGEGPYALYWKWGNRETKQTVTLPTTGLGTVTVDGAAVTETTSFWYPETATVAVTAVPADGATFACWQGDVLWPDICTAAITLAAADVHSVSPRFYTTREGAVRTWKGNDGDYYTAANWTDGVVPGPLDSIVITKGTCTARKYLEVAALTLSGSGKLTVSDAYDIKVAGDLTLTNGVTLTVNGTPRTDDRTFETGTTHVQVGGDFVIATNATLKVVSDAWTGGSPVFKVAGGFALSVGAAINADKSGWSWVEYTGTKSPLALATATANGKKWQTMALGHGSSYGTAGTYGGRGGATNGNMPGVPYGFANAPFYPGSPNGVYNETLFTTGGGLVRIHVDGFATVAGAITANGGTQGSNFGGSSGGGIWLTAAKFAFAPTAKLSAKGGPSGYSSLGGGGRIAIGTGLTAAQVASLIATGTCGRRAKDDAFFKAEFPGVAVDVSRGNPTGSWAPYGEAGSFSYYPTPQGLKLLVR